MVEMADYLRQNHIMSAVKQAERWSQSRDLWVPEAIKDPDCIVNKVGYHPWSKAKNSQKDIAKENTLLERKRTIARESTAATFISKQRHTTS